MTDAEKIEALLDITSRIDHLANCKSILPRDRLRYLTDIGRRLLAQQDRLTRWYGRENSNWNEQNRKEWEELAHAIAESPQPRKLRASQIVDFVKSEMMI